MASPTLPHRSTAALEDEGEMTPKAAPAGEAEQAVIDLLYRCQKGALTRRLMLLLTLWPSKTIHIVFFFSEKIILTPLDSSLFGASGGIGWFLS